MRILVATRNRDKFNIVKRLVEATVPDAHLVFLGDTPISGDVVEAGSIHERARQKAVYFWGRLEWSTIADDFDSVLAVDDGLSVGGAEATPHSKEMTERILSEAWPTGTKVDVVRAFCLIRRGEVPRVELTAIPFVFVGNPHGVQREDGTYPLSQVLSPEGMAQPVSQLTNDEEDAFYLRHSREPLVALFS